MGENKSISFQYSARYSQLGVFSRDTMHVWIVLHGYGQLAPYFIRKFKAIDAPQNVLIAPEGLSRFYMEGFSGRVGATWMTKEDRERDIENYVKYLDAIYLEIVDQLDSSQKVKVHVMAFSQGVATASRWLALGEKKEIASLSFWAGVFPPDLPLDLSKERLMGMPLYFLVGNEDPFVSEEKIAEFNSTFKRLSLPCEVITFAGAHDIEEKTLLNLYSRIVNGA